MIKLPEGYIQREAAPELDLISRVHGRFKGIGEVMPASQRKIYENIKNIFQEDVKKFRGFPKTIRFARQLFERLPNNIYYTPQLTFDTVDAKDEQRDMMEFDYVICVEVIEHIPSTEADSLITFLNRFVKKAKGGGYVSDESRTKIYLTTPNRNAPNIQKDTPRNEHHCFEATAAEMYEFLTSRYQNVTVLDENLVPQELGTEATPLVYKLENPL